jgi:hypothetical protein
MSVGCCPRLGGGQGNALRHVAIITLGLAVVCLDVTTADSPEIKVFAPKAIATVLNEICQEFERQTNWLWLTMLAS